MHQETLKEAYKGVQEILRRYWLAYGGFRAIVRSPYLHLSIGLVALTHSVWTAPNWWTTVTAIMPNIIGFSLGGYAIWLGLGDANFRELLSGAEVEGEISPYLKVNATFVHFIILQVLALLAALIAAALYFEPDPKGWILLLIRGLRIDETKFLPAVRIGGWFVGYWVFLYALLTAVAATLNVFRVAWWYDIHQTNERKKRNGQRGNVPKD